MIKENKIIIALDTNNLEKAINVVSNYKFKHYFKIGMEFFMLLDIQV